MGDDEGIHDADRADCWHGSTGFCQKVDVGRPMHHRNIEVDEARDAGGDENEDGEGDGLRSR